MGFFQRFIDYLMSKRSEVSYLNHKDALLGILVGQIHASKKSEKKAFIAIEDVLPIHAIDRTEALKKVEERVITLRAHKEEIEGKGKISQQTLAKILPSISHFKVVPYKGKFVSIEGNGRLLAIKKVFAGIAIEVDVLEVKGLERKIRRIRALNNLE